MTTAAPDDNATGKIVVTGTVANGDDYHTIPGSRHLFEFMCERVDKGHALRFNAGKYAYFIPASKVTELAFLPDTDQGPR